MSLRLPRAFLPASAVLGAVVALTCVGPAQADTIVSPGGKPGVATKWSAKGDSVRLEIKEGFSPSEVADAILRGVPGAEVTLHTHFVVREDAQLLYAFADPIERKLFRTLIGCRPCLQ